MAKIDTGSEVKCYVEHYERILAQSKGRISSRHNIKQKEHTRIQRADKSQHKRKSEYTHIKASRRERDTDK